jgi:hypothetical protein
MNSRDNQCLHQLCIDFKSIIVKLKKNDYKVSQIFNDI